ncbi:MAG: cytochrome c biogenesis protein CcsA [Ignavibacteriales bacterium]|nr:cytochrome c biogenesis protein CcsA [Ignavibacteriales bacterium]
MMTIYAVLHAVLLLLVIVKNPFTMLWDAFPGQVTPGTVPADGKGLNPLLQNMWMAIHPPILFLGFAAMAVPFALAMTALWKKLYHDWTMFALPWILFGIASLGAGIMLGGYWAYGVLGWGGWWGWDPVENSSLIPWMVGLILLHTILIQKKTGALVRTNLALGLLSYILVVYSTFLTRSGILGQASVHSFVDPGALVYWLLIIWIAGSVVAGGVFLSKRWSDMAPLKLEHGVFKRETILSAAAALLGLTTLIVFFGTNWPIMAKASLEPSFYNKTNLPMAILMALFLGASLFVRWHEDSRTEFLKRSALSLIGSVLGIVALAVAGVREVLVLVFACVSFFAFFANVTTLMNLIRENVRFIGGPLSHIGIALLFLGIIGSGFYGEKKTIALPQGEPKDVLVYTVTYVKPQQTADGKQQYHVNVEHGGVSYALAPVMFESSYNNSLMRTPDYINMWTKDFYIEPVSVERQQPQARAHGTTIDLEKGRSLKVGDMTVSFLRFDMAAHGMQQAENGFAVGAVLEVKRGNTSKQVTPVAIVRNGIMTEYRNAMLDETIGFQLLNMNIDMQTKRSSVEISIIGMNGSPATYPLVELLVVEASLKPYISLVWIGSVLMIVGASIAMMRRRNAVVQSSAAHDIRRQSAQRQAAVEESTTTAV